MSQSSPLESLYQEELYVLKPKVIVILPKSWQEIPAEDQQLLSKILGSVKLTLSAVQILSCREFDVADLQAYAPSQIIAFGSISKNSADRYEILTIHGSSLLQVDHLHNLDDLKKKTLWSALKQMFGL